MKSHISTFLMLLCFNALFAQIHFADDVFYQKRSPVEVITIADFNNDGLEDVAIGMGAYFFREDNYRIAIFTQDANGDLTETAEFPYIQNGQFSEIKSMCSGDVNNDQLADLIITYDDSLVFYTQGTSEKPGIRLSYFVGNGADNAHCADLNGDGLDDIAVASSNDNYVRVFYQTSGNFTTKDYQKPNNGRSDIEVGDFNGDGRNDLVVSGQQDNGGLYFYTQNTSGELIFSGDIFRGNAFNSIAVADIDMNGTDDVIFTSGTNYFNAEVGIIYQVSPPLLINFDVEIIDRYNESSAIQVFDVDCDGRKEVVNFFENDNRIGLFISSEEGEYNYNQLRANTQNATKPQASAIGDLNNDGKYDVAFVSGFGFSVFINESVVNSTTDTVFVGIANDTTLGTPVTESDIYVRITTDTVNGDYIATSDSFIVRTSTTVDRIIQDSIFKVFGEGCIASTYLKSTEFTSTQAHADTVFVSTFTECLNCSEACDIYIPTAFTPNGDGQNDVFVPVSSCVFLSYHLVVYDRWSEIIFDSKDAAVGWDGRYKSNVVKQDVYSFTLKAKTDRKDFKLAGKVVLIK